MEPVTSVILAWLLFGTTHIGLASAPMRGPIIARLGNAGFAAVFSLVASITLGILCYVYSEASTQGPAGFGLGASVWLRWPLALLSTFGIVCAACSLLDYNDSAYALSIPGQKPEPRGFDRITRHGFAVGLALVGIAHALLATRLTGTVFFAALAVFAIVGSVHQDAKLRARNPSLHGPFLEKTSLLPFVAILSGRNQLVLSELRPLAIVLGLLAAWGLRHAHPYIFAHGGVYVTGASIGGALVITAYDAWLMMQRKRRRRSERAAMEHDPLPRAGR